MKVYNQDKTQVLEEYDLKKGYLKEDTILVNYEEVEAIEEQGHYEVIAEYPNGGKDVKWVVEVAGREYKPARTEEERIKIYIPYNEEEMKIINLNNLRARREPLLIAFDKYKSNVTYGVEIETQEDREIVINWYRKILDLDETAMENVPKKIKYYL